MASIVGGFDRIRDNSDLFDAAKVHVRKGGNFFDAAKLAREDLFAVSWEQGADKNADASARECLARPQLAEPKRVKSQSGDAAMTQLMAELAILLGQSMVDDLKNRLGIFKNMMASRQANLVKLEADALKALAEEAKAINGLESATNELNVLKEELWDLTWRQQETAWRDQEIVRVQAKIYIAEMIVREALNICEEKSTVVGVALGALMKVTQQLSQELREKLMTSEARVVFLMAVLIGLIGQNGETALKNSLLLFESMQDSRQAALEKSAEAMEAEVRKAEEAQRISGCIGKIIGALIMVVAIVATVASFGTATALGVALGAVGLALMVADAAVGAITGQSLTDRALAPVMEPLMKNVIMPMMEFFQKTISSVLTGLGVAKEMVEKIASIMAAVVTAIVVIVVMVIVMMVAKAAASKMASLVGKVAGAAAKKMGPKFVTAMARTDQVVGRAASQAAQKLGFKTDATSVQIYSKQLGRAQNVLTVANSGVRGAGNIAVGVNEAEAAIHAAAFVMSENMIRQLTEFIKMAMDTLPSTQNMIESMTTAMSRIVAKQTETGRLILAGARNAGKSRA